ncbi:short-chain dehydrogenase/reductase SDR [Fibrisoma limi BUZ 3]|uniref:Short-chain dehydrogenase/reductase SDR n=1 Tax=Fibrisoma limi BUZ 3 TaxID=1185876 RepID=I2GK16_9BACT|nr:SDR family oxidoreductase [Fibrisoma limi]CCH54241.1 short-chain dehydrogenase/reductase SDR [Fibrisoma limi BUZ 3]
MNEFNSKNELVNKVALITGGNSGIGYATAKVLHAAGASVIITGRNEESVEKAAKELNVTGMIADQRDLSTLDPLFDQIIIKHSKIDILFLNAGVGTFQSIDSVTEASFNLIMDTNVKGTFFTLQKLLPLISNGGSIIFNASVTPLLGIPNSSVYAGSKAAIVSMARVLAKELSFRSIRVNTVSPGAIKTGVHSASPTAHQRKIVTTPQKLKAFENAVEQRILLGRYGLAEEVGNVVKFLASDEASFINGSVITVDGGVTVDPLGY